MGAIEAHHHIECCVWVLWCSSFLNPAMVVRCLCCGIGGNCRHLGLCVLGSVLEKRRRNEKSLSNLLDFSTSPLKGKGSM